MSTPKEIESFQNENYEEAEMGQLHSLHLSMNGIEAVRAKLPTGPSLSHCIECGAKIPTKRRKTIPGVKLCVPCQEYLERRRP